MQSIKVSFQVSTVLKDLAHTGQEIISLLMCNCSCSLRLPFALKDKSQDPQEKGFVMSKWTSLCLLRVCFNLKDKSQKSQEKFR